MTHTFVNMQKWIFSFLIIVVFFIGYISQSVLILNYELRKDYFATILCEKKDVPNNSCKGGCHLNKELRSQTEQERKQGYDSQVKFEMDFVLSSLVLEAILENSFSLRFPPYSSKVYLTVLYIDFRPPTA